MVNSEINVHDETFRILDMSALDWAFRKLAEIKAADAEIKQRADAQYEKIKQWEDKERGKLNEEINYFENLIQDFHFRTLMENPKAKTLSTPFGKSKSRRSAPAPEQVDKKALLEFVQENNMRDYIKEDVKWADLKKSLQITEKDGAPVVVDENGQIVPGVIVKPETINYTVEVD